MINECDIIIEESEIENEEQTKLIGKPDTNVKLPTVMNEGVNIGSVPRYSSQIKV